VRSKPREMARECSSGTRKMGNEKVVESWREMQSYYRVMKRLREPIAS
jgi:hypothetical protein